MRSANLSESKNPGRFSDSSRYCRNPLPCQFVSDLLLGCPFELRSLYSRRFAEPTEHTAPESELNGKANSSAFCVPKVFRVNPNPSILESVPAPDRTDNRGILSIENPLRFVRPEDGFSVGQAGVNGGGVLNPFHRNLQKESAPDR